VTCSQDEELRDPHEGGGRGEKASLKAGMGNEPSTVWTRLLKNIWEEEGIYGEVDQGPRGRGMLGRIVEGKKDGGTAVSLSEVPEETHRTR